MNSLFNLGFRFNPFEHLDSTRDVHLQEYLVIPKTVEISLSDQPVAIFAHPGGGKSALRIYTANFYKDSRGVRFPITYLPETFSNEANFHFDGIKRSLARAVFIYLISYPDLFFALSPRDRQKLKSLLMDIPLGLNFNLRTLSESRFISELEQTLDVPAFSTLPRLDHIHYQLAQELAKESPYKTLNLDDSFALLQDVFEAKSIHILIDGLDGFIETQSARVLLMWIEPMLSVLENWNGKNIYLKFFLPLDISDVPELAKSRNYLRAAALTWDDNLLAEVIRRRVFVASGGAFDSLDAISTPNVRNVELTLAYQLREKEKLPRQIILKCQNLLQQVIKYNRIEISPEDLFFTREQSYVTAI